MIRAVQKLSVDKQSRFTAGLFSDLVHTPEIYTGGDFQIEEVNAANTHEQAINHDHGNWNWSRRSRYSRSIFFHFGRDFFLVWIL